ncbi:unnamed protein product [Schistosoma mattheei]|uniref:Uncharacterized protein n=1 Tax=Schistosoma mattheei TaxID=31246 RepID=A0A183NMD5_9TREM|nr:unnamed protein product [Schistosoma mattheei]
MRGPIRAMNAHAREPLRLGGRPLSLAYTPSTPTTSLWISDLPPSLANLTDEELLHTLSQIAPVQEFTTPTHILSRLLFLIRTHQVWCVYEVSFTWFKLLMRLKFDFSDQFCFLFLQIRFLIVCIIHFYIKELLFYSVHRCTLLINILYYV